MPQSLIRMPKTADMEIAGWSIHIDDHEVVGVDGLFGNIMYIIIHKYSSWKTMADFENHGISFEAAVEECVRELENKADILKQIIFWFYKVHQITGIYVETIDLLRFSESVAGRKIAEQFIEKIRSCENWQELYDEMHLTSKFQKEMKNRIKKEMKQLCLKS